MPIADTVAAFQFVLLTCSTILTGQQREYQPNQAAIFAQLRDAAQCDAQALVNKAAASSHAAIGRAYALTSGGRAASARRSSATSSSSTPSGQGLPQPRSRSAGTVPRRTQPPLSLPAADNLRSRASGRAVLRTYAHAFRGQSPSVPSASRHELQVQPRLLVVPQG